MDRPAPRLNQCPRRGLVTADAVDATVADLETQAMDPDTVHTLSRSFQSWGRRPAKAP